MRFFFDMDDSGVVTRDDIGIACPNLDAARIEAIIRLTDVARDWLPYDGNNRDIALTIRDQSKRLVRVSFRFEVQSLDESVPGDDKVMAQGRQRQIG